MRVYQRYALWVAAPLVFATGCAGGPTLFSNARRARDADPAERMMQVAKGYEETGRYEAAQRLYQQLAHMQPSNQIVRVRLEALAQRSQSGAPGILSEPTATKQEAAELLALLRENEAAYEAARDAQEKQPTLAPATVQLPQFALAGATAPKPHATASIAIPEQSMPPAETAAAVTLPQRDTAIATADVEAAEFRSEDFFPADQPMAADVAVSEVDPSEGTGESLAMAEPLFAESATEVDPEAIPFPEELGVGESATGNDWAQVIAAAAGAKKPEVTQANVAADWAPTAGDDAEIVPAGDIVWTKTAVSHLCPDLTPEL
ncbi:MAG: hypothetical protein KDA58_17000, partial [Planctomycetaceae bacterium]|nr:hypothetical protein [Planctomycetaceae bacterium]